MNYELFLRDYQQTIFDDLDIEFLRSLKPFPADLANNYLNSKLRILVKTGRLSGNSKKWKRTTGMLSSVYFTGSTGSFKI